MFALRAAAARCAAAVSPAVRTKPAVFTPAWNPPLPAQIHTFQLAPARWPPPPRSSSGARGSQSLFEAYAANGRRALHLRSPLSHAPLPTPALRAPSTIYRRLLALPPGAALAGRGAAWSLPAGAVMSRRGMSSWRPMASGQGGGGGGRGRLWSSLVSIGAGLSLLAGKTKYLIGALKVTKLSTVLSLLLSTGAYAMFYGWPYAVGVVGQLFLHESGHALMMLRNGITPSAMVFIPFMGAVVGGTCPNAWVEVKVAAAGPVAGAAAALALTAYGIATDSNLCLALAEFGYMINLFNLLPIGTMDGGRILSSLSKWWLVAGLGAGGGLLLARDMPPLFYLIMMFGGFTVFERFSKAGAVEHLVYYSHMTPARKAATGGIYLATAFVLLAGMEFNGRFKKSPKQLTGQPENTWGDDDFY